MLQAPDNTIFSAAWHGCPGFFVPLGQLSVEPVFGWLAVIPLAIVMFASLWLTLSAAGLSRRARGWLVFLRLSAMVLLLIGWLRPAMVSQSQRESSGAIAVLMDRSQSMTLPSDVSGQDRWQVQADVWRAIVAETDLRIGQTVLVPYFYDSQPAAAPADDLPQLSRSFSESPTGRLTDVGAALAKIATQQLDPPLRGLILMGDGVQTRLPPEVDASLAARQMAQRDQPIMWVGIGPRSESGLVKSVSLDGLPEQLSAFVKKELSVPLVVNAQSMQGIPIQIDFTLRSSGKPDQKVASRQVLASKPDEKLAMEFNVLVADAGEYLLEATASVDGQQQSQVTGFVTVREGGARILYLEGQPRHEQTFLKRSLRESPDFIVEYALYPERDRKLWPRNLNIDWSQYEAFVIGDLDAAALSNSDAAALLSRVRRGAGILFIGGYRSFDSGGYGRSPLEPLFPMQLRNSYPPWDAPPDAALHIFDDVPLRPTRPHPITALASGGDNARVWEQLKPMQGMNRFGTLKRDPGIQVLLEGPNREPALVTRELGSGRVLAFAGDSTWRWWLAGESRVHQQFWRQAMLWLIGRDSLDEGFRLRLDRRRFLIDDRPQLSIEWFGGTEDKPMPDEIKVELSREGRWLRNLDSRVESPDRRRIEVVGLDQPGLYRAALTASGPDGQQYATDIAFVVRDESRELSQPGADWQMMANVISANSAAGGQLVLPEEIGAALGKLREYREQTKVITLEKRRLGDAAWDSWLVLVGFCGLMSIEWALRKSWQLP